MRSKWTQSSENHQRGGHHARSSSFCRISFQCDGVFGTLGRRTEQQSNRATEQLRVGEQFLKKLSSAVQHADSSALAELVGRPNLQGKPDFERWASGQYQAIREQFGSNSRLAIQISRVESAGDEMQIFVLKNGVEHSKPLHLRNVAGSWILSLSPSDLGVTSKPSTSGVGSLAQAALGDRYPYPTVLTNYTSNPQTVICDDAAGGVLSTWLGTVFYNSTQIANCPSWQCTWFGSTCTVARVQGCGSGGCEKVCANVLAGDDVWVTNSGINCYIAWY